MSTSRSLTLILLTSAAMAGEAIAPPLTLAAAIEASQSQHPNASVALARLAEAQARLRQANAVLLPRLSVGSSYTVTDQPAMAFMGLINHGAYSPTINANEPPTVDNLNLGATIQVPLYTPGTWSGRAAAQHGAAAARSAQEATRNALILTTVQAFISVHQAKAHVIAATAALRSSEANLATARTRNQTGNLSKADLLGLEAMQAGARSRMAAANGGLDLAGQALAAALGREGSITEVAAMPDVPAPTAESLGERPELTAAREQAAAAEAGVDQARAQHLPRLGAFGGYGYDRGFKQEGEGQSWHVGVGVEWTIFAGGGTEAGVDEAEAKQRAARAELRRASLQISQGRTAARTRFVTITEQLAAATSQHAAAEEAERLQAERFAAGAATASDLAAAEAVLAQARAAVADSQAGLRMTIADLRWQYGLPILP
jgi:outer membrane protein